MFPLKLLGNAALFLAKGHILRTKKGAQFATPKEYNSYLSPDHTGLLMDGITLRLSETKSFQNVCVIANVGAGKTSRYIIPNVLCRGRENTSIVVNDPKGEVFEATSGYMQRQGFNVRVIDFENPARSSCFNSLLEARNNIELEQIAQVIIHAGSPPGKDQTWNIGASRILAVLLKCLRNMQYFKPGMCTLANANYLIQNFGPEGRDISEFMGRASVNPRDIRDMSLYNEWIGSVRGNKEGVNSFLLNAANSLRLLTNDSVARLLSRSDFQMDEIRQKKTIIYFITPAHLLEYYAPIISIFFRCVFNMCMREIPDRKTLPVYILYDEFGHSTILNFVSTANTIRAYKVSLSIVLQSISQLEARYGKIEASAIQGGFSTYMTYSGSDLETSQFFERLAGRVVERNRHDFNNPQREQQLEYNLMNADAIRRIAMNKALLVSGNQQPALINTEGYFERPDFIRHSKIRPFQPAQTELPQLEYVRL